MSEFEAATIAYQNASLAISQESLQLSYWQALGTFAQAGVALVIGGLQCGLIYVGLRRMGEASAERKAQHTETMTAMQTQHEENMAAHAESMTALKELIVRTAPRP